MMLPIAILAGGLATRLRPLTDTIPKSLVVIHDEPFIAHQLRYLRANGFTKVILCLGYLGEMVADYVGDGKQFDLQVCYSFDSPKLLGTAGAIKQALPLLDDNFFVLYGDSYLTCNYAIIQNYFLECKKKSLMTVFHNQGQWDKSNVEFCQNEILSYDKQHQTERMQHIDYGLGVFNKAAFNPININEIADLALLYQNLLHEQQLAAYEIAERFYEIGSFAGIKELGHFLT